MEDKEYNEDWIKAHFLKLPRYRVISTSDKLVYVGGVEFKVGVDLVTKENFYIDLLPGTIGSVQSVSGNPEMYEMHPSGQYSKVEDFGNLCLVGYKFPNEDVYYHFICPMSPIKVLAYLQSVGYATQTMEMGVRPESN